MEIGDEEQPVKNRWLYLLYYISSINYKRSLNQRDKTRMNISKRKLKLYQCYKTYVFSYICTEINYKIIYTQLQQTSEK